ncbi:MAG: family 16 glycoside hydrolase [Opitutus sp.]
MIISRLSFAWIAFGFALVPAVSAATAPDPEIVLFDGESLAGWKAAEQPSAFRIEDGAIVCNGPRAHLFYMGTEGAAEFENFEFSAEVKTRPGSNSGIFIHTKWQESNWPLEGFEVQVNNSQKQHGNYRENKMTGSLYGIRNLYKAVAPDDEWFEMTIRVEKPRIRISVNGVLVVDYIEPRDPLPAGVPKLTHLGRGTFALQAHDPESTAAYRNIRVKRLPDGTDANAVRPTWDDTAAQLLGLGKDNFPLLDAHTRLVGGLNLDEALAASRERGTGVGILIDGSAGPIHDDASALPLIESMRQQPVFLGLYESTASPSKLSEETQSRFDYLVADTLRFIDATGREIDLTKATAAELGTDEQAFMDQLVAQAVETISARPIDVYSNATYLPAALASKAAELWTTGRMQKVIDAAVKEGVAFELNARTKQPSEAFVRLARQAGAKFAIGSDNTSAADFSDWAYPLEVQRKVGITWKDMWVPGHEPSRSRRAFHPSGSN